MNRVNGVYFSPTQTSERILIAAMEGYGNIPSSMVNLTYEDSCSNYMGDDLVFFAFPVYSGRIPSIALERLTNLRGNGAKAVIIAVYGNRAFDDALLELATVVESLGFSVISAAAFIGEHSFSRENYPIAAGRPDSRDLEKARGYGKMLFDRSGRVNGYQKPIIPGTRPYREGSAKNTICPDTDENLCTLCLVCSGVCPTGAIDSSAPMETNGEKCIRCCACIKICTEKARAFHNPSIQAVTETLFRQFSERREPELFF